MLKDKTYVPYIIYSKKQLSMGCCTSQINHDLEMAIQKVKEIESQSRQHEEEYVVPPRYMYLKKETPFLVPPLGNLCIYSKCLQDLKSVLERLFAASILTNRTDL